MKRTLSLKLGVAIIALLLICFASCSKMDGTYAHFLEGGEIRYGKKPDSTGVYPGHNRAKVWLAVSAPNVTRCKIYWNNRLDSVEIPIVRTLKTDTISTIINNLEEGKYTFEFIMYDEKGNSSLAVDTEGDVYGDNYISSKHPRNLGTAGILNNVLTLTWLNESNNDALWSEVQYTRTGGGTQVVKVNNGDTETIISPRPVAGSIKYKTSFLPHPKAIDTFYSSLTAIKPVSVYAGFPETLEDKQYVKVADASATIEIGSGLWLFSSFRIGESGNDKKNGARSARSHATQTGIIEMKYDLPDGASKFSFYHAICASDGLSTFKVQASTDGGLNWKDVSPIYTNTATLQYKEIELNIVGQVRFRIYKFSSTEDITSVGRMNIDDIDIYPNL